MTLLKGILACLTNHVPQFISRDGIGCFYFSGKLLLPFNLLHDIKILVKSRQGRTFSCLNCLLAPYTLMTIVLAGENFLKSDNEELTRKNNFSVRSVLAITTGTQ